MNTFPLRSGWRLLLMLALGTTSLYGQQFDGVLRGHEGAVLMVCSLRMDNAPRPSAPTRRPGCGISRRANYNVDTISTQGRSTRWRPASPAYAGHRESGQRGSRVGSARVRGR